jgi:hypothetical protein
MTASERIRAARDGAIQVTAPMPNGASIADWLGTAKTAAFVAAHLIEDVREERTATPLLDLSRAEDELMQALEEVRAIRKRTAS